MNPKLVLYFLLYLSLIMNHQTGSPSSKTGPRDFWRQQFHSGAPQAPEKSGGEDAIGSKSERQEQEARPRSIKGLGEEAYWISNPVTGVLYVLQGDRFLRISIGGIREEPARLEKSKTLARAALKRM